MQSGELLWWAIIIGAFLLFIVGPQWLSRRKQAQKMAAYKPGDRIITIGGFIGTLTYIDRDENVARVRLGEGVEVEIVPGAISRTLVAAEAPEPAAEMSDEETASSGDAEA
ncbi:MAG: preprotein translocase subunit YajC [Anaerolineae bacterium]|nr:preprotein translocase subunit YajC [Anaerolineae bacterium]